MTLGDWLVVRRNRLQDLVIMKTNNKLTVLWIIFVIGSFSHDYFPLPKWYFSKPKNILNQYFVKIGWGWTFLLVGGYLVALLIKNRIDSILIYAKHLGRLMVETGFWYLCTSSFEMIEDLTGQCLGNPEIKSKIACRKAAFPWDGFDISGHTFLLTFCVLIINEELSRAKKFMTRYHVQPSNNQNHVETEIINVFGLGVKEKMLDAILEILSLALILLMLLWEVMLFFTCAYFHSLLQKLIGLVIGVSSYYTCYRFLFNAEGLLLLRRTVNRNQ